MYDVIVKKFTFAISSPEEFLLKIHCGKPRSRPWLRNNVNCQKLFMVYV